jgi:hypothetical protein
MVPESSALPGSPLFSFTQWILIANQNCRPRLGAELQKAVVGVGAEHEANIAGFSAHSQRLQPCPALYLISGKLELTIGSELYAFGLRGCRLL